MDFKVGQVVCVRWNRVSARRSERVELIAIESIGRRWVTLRSGVRFDMNDPRRALDGGDYSSPGEVFLSADEERIERRLSEAWRSIRNDIRDQFGVPSDMTIERIDLAREALGLPPIGGSDGNA